MLQASLAEKEKLTTSLRESVEELEAFSYSLSHDMRAPLRTIQGFSEIIRESAGPALTEENREMLDRVIRAAQRLDELIRDVLTFARLSKQSMTLAPIDTQKLMSDILVERPELRVQGDRIEILNELHPVVGHEASLTQCITNILSNAIKFTQEVPHIKISSEESGGWVRLWFEDNGIGIDKADQDRIFGVFNRVHAHDRYPGTGIGGRLRSWHH
jgi:light-regulated signal transduction histidine kinase (bacteriophytochrome)